MNCQLSSRIFARTAPIKVRLGKANMGTQSFKGFPVHKLTAFNTGRFRLERLL